MKVFVLTSRIPFPLEKGDKLRAYHQLKELSKSHTLYLCALKNPFIKVPSEAKNELLKICKEVYFIDRSWIRILFRLTGAIFTKVPFQTAFFTDTMTKKEVHHLIKLINPDHIYCQLTRTAEYVRKITKNKTIDYMDAFSLGMLQRAKRKKFILKWIYNWEAKKQRNYEREVFDDFNYHTIISHVDRTYINHPLKDKIKIVPNGVHSKYFKPIIVDKDYDIVFVGNMGYPPNIDAAKFLCLNILPLIKEKLPNTTILIAGANPPTSIKKLNSQTVHVSGWINDIRSAYASAKVFIAPMRIGTGLQNKLLEAMSMKKACITTSIVNDTLKAPHKAVCIGNTAIELADISIELLTNTDKRHSIAHEGKNFVRDSYQWQKSTEILNELFK